MTVPEILKELRPVKKLSRPRLYHYFRKFKIKPITRGIRPQHYAANTANRLKLKLRLNGKLR